MDKYGISVTPPMLCGDCNSQLRQKLEVDVAESKMVFHHTCDKCKTCVSETFALTSIDDTKYIEE